MEQWPAWRLVLENVATLEELKTSYSYDDIARANAMLDLKRYLEDKATKGIKDDSAGTGK